jgi:hypothetical protein
MLLWCSLDETETNREHVIFGFDYGVDSHDAGNQAFWHCKLIYFALKLRGNVAPFQIVNKNFFFQRGD